MAGNSPTSRTKHELEKQGYTVAIVEHWNAFAHIRQDLYGFIDLLAMREGEPLLAIQTTTTGNLSSRKKKSAAGLGYLWLSTGCKFELWGWDKRGEKGKRQLWTLTRRYLDGGSEAPVSGDNHTGGSRVCRALEYV